MKKKLVGIFVCMLLLVTALPVMTSEERNAVCPMGCSSTETTNDAIQIGGIRGGMRVSAVVRNTLSIPIGDVEWKIEFEGLIFSGSATGTIESLEPDEQTIIHSSIVFGFGSGWLRVTAGDTDKAANFFAFGMMIFVFPN